MATLRRIAFALVSLCALGLSVSAQKTATAQAERVPVTATATSERVRFAAPNRVARLKLEVLSPSGEVVAEVATRGSVLEWTLSGAQGGRLPDGQYLCVLTVKDAAGGLAQRLTLLEVSGAGVTSRGAAAADLTAWQAEAVGPVRPGAFGSAADDLPAATLRPKRYTSALRACATRQASRPSRAG